MNNIKDLMSLRGCTALITGANGNLGRVMSNALGEIGADLLLVDINASGLELFASELEKKWGIKAETYLSNLEEESERTNLIEIISNSGKSLEVLINNAAFVGSSEIEGWSTPFENQSLNAWRRALELNLTCTFHLCQGLMPLLEKSGRGSIINIASIYGHLGPNWSLYDGTTMANPAGYSASKGAVIQFSRWLATTVAPRVRVNSISPGGIVRNQPKVFVDKYITRTPLHRMANENDFIGAIAYLSTNLSSYVTGHDLVVDGGFSSW
jgi:NAD(P)-dependent dehydrogenase (short-subunit alcohol dehydrogenase family)